VLGQFLDGIELMGAKVIGDHENRQAGPAGKGQGTSILVGIGAQDAGLADQLRVERPLQQAGNRTDADARRPAQ